MKLGDSLLGMALFILVLLLLLVVAFSTGRITFSQHPEPTTTQSPIGSIQ